MIAVQKTLAELAQFLNAELIGEPNQLITGVAPLQAARPGCLSFLDNPRYAKYLANTQASVVIISPAFREACPVAALITANPYLAYAKVAGLFAPVKSVAPGIHPSAIIGEHCQIDATASIGPYCVLGDNVTIGPKVVIEAHCDLGDRVVIGAHSHLYPRVNLYHDVRIGQRTIIHSGAVLGADGFGIANDKGRWIKVPQLGGVLVGDDVEIGANTTIDRGALLDTIIEEGVKLDNQIQIAHNVKIGAHTAIAGCAGIAGSTEIGQHCIIGGGACIGGHLNIAAKTMISGMAMITNSISEPGIYSSGTGMQKQRDWHKSVARFHQLDQLARRLKKLEDKK